MEEIIKSPYEISVWEDVFVTGTYDTETNEIVDAENEIEGDTYASFDYIKERKLAIIGSNTMTSPARAMEPCLTRNVNGTVTLKFYMFNSYYDDEEDSIVLNPYKNLLINETKLKMKYRGEWYDLIVKSIDQDLEQRKTSFTASSLFINELSKNGFDIEFDTELSNNIGNITTLADTILEESDWEVDKENSDNLSQTTEEALFKVKTSIDLTAYPLGSYYTDNQETVLLDAGTVFYAFYSSVKSIKDGESTLLQICYHSNGEYKIDDNYVIQEDSVSIFDNQLYIENITYVEENKTYLCDDTECFDSLSIDYEELYRGDRLVLGSGMVYEPITERVCYKYLFDVDENYWADIEYQSGIPLSNISFNEQSFLTSYQSILRPYLWTSITIDGALEGYAPTFDCFTYFNKVTEEDEESTQQGTYEFYGYKQTDGWIWKLNDEETVDLKDYGISVNYDKIKSTSSVITVVKNNSEDKLLFNINLQVTIENGEIKGTKWRIINPNTSELIPINGEALGFGISSYSFSSNNENGYYNEGVYEGVYEISIQRESKKTDKQGYMVEDIDYITSSALCNYIGDGDTFVNNESWEVYNGVEAEYTIYPKLEEIYDSEGNKQLFRDFLYFNSGDTYYNKLTNVFTNYKTNGFVEGDSYIFRIAGGTAEWETSGNYNVLTDYPTDFTEEPLGDIIICDYKIEGKSVYLDTSSCYVRFARSNDLGLNDYEYTLTVDTQRVEGKKYFLKDEEGTYTEYTDSTIPSGAYEATTFNKYISYVGTCMKSLDRESIYSGVRERDDDIWRIGVFIEVNQDIAIESFQMFDYIVNDDNSVCALGSVPSSTAKKTYTYFYLADGAITENDVVYVHIGKEKWELTQDGIDHNVRVYKEEKPFEKIRTISAKESNRFNLIQELCETFECWALFSVPHNSNGEIKLQWSVTDEGVSYSPIKKITFKEKIGENLGYGFKYGFNLKSMSRSIDSDSLVTKLIVPANSNEYALNGFCTIQRSEYNETKQSYLLNFNYYIQHDMLDYKQVYKDFYEDGAFFDQLSENGAYISEAVAERSVQSNNLINLESTYKTYDEAINSCISVKNETLETIRDLLISFGVEADEYTEYQLLIKAKDYVTPNTDDYSEKMSSLYASYQQTDLQQNIYTVKRDSLDESLATTRTYIAIAEEKIKTFQEISNKISRQIYKKYYRFIQEGTWQSEDYYDDDLYYIDAKDVLGSSCVPQVKYNISVIDLKDLTEYSNITFDLGDVSFVQDPEFFGYTRAYGIKTPYKQEVVISEITEYPESPENNSITVQNFKTQFEDLFQRITAATQSLQYASGGYNRATKAITASGSIDSTVLSNSLNNNGEVSITNSASQSNTYGDEGLVSTNLINNNNQIKIINGDMYSTTDGGITWKDSDSVVKEKASKMFLIDGTTLYISVN